MYALGKGVATNYAEAFRWNQKAAEQGDAAAQCTLGRMYFRGTGVATSYAEAAKWWRKAAEQDDVNAQDSLGLMLRHWPRR